MTLLAIFTAKYNMNDWKGEENLTEVRVWIIIDCYYFLAFIISGIIFVTVAYVVKFNPTSKDEELLLMDENPWNDKDTEDFLRHMKQEYFVFCYFLTAFILDVILYFPGKDFGAGVKDFNPTKLILLFDMFTRANNIIILIVISSLKMKIT